LLVDFGPNVNFIHGNNGSGKSAILLGICICLGMRASETKRASSVKGLIKHGENHAIVAVTLANAGKFAFQNEIFGNEIVVEKHLSRNGSNKYVLKGESGKEVKGDRGMLDRILSHFGIIVDCILNQETAREYLKSNSPSKRFEYFLEATQLQSMNIY
jgi:chromosome segregation ATPase